jgi:Ni,Fe-hydrogenase I cytochrome b subunit
MSTAKIQEILNLHFSGELDQTILYVRLGVFAIGVLFTGLVLWRITVIFLQKKLKQRRRTSRFERKWR